MTNSNVNAPVVKTSHPELYAEHTFHMSKARKYTYNYVVIDEVIRELWGEMTVEEMAEALNEYSAGEHEEEKNIDLLESAGYCITQRSMERRGTIVWR